MEPKDSPIWSFIQNHHINLPEPIKQAVYVRLQECAVPATDKIFPWIVEAIINRVLGELLRGELQETRQELKVAPDVIGRQMIESVKTGLADPVQEIRGTRNDIRKLTEELRASAIVDASIGQSGWRGIGAAIGAIFRLKNLSFVVLMMVSATLGLGLALGSRFSDREREIIDFNTGVIQDCDQNFAADADKNGWYTCPIFQLPMPRK